MAVRFSGSLHHYRGMPAMAFVDGAIGPLAEARIPITDRGFLWGDHAFDAIPAGLSGQVALFYTERFLADVFRR